MGAAAGAAAATWLNRWRLSVVNTSSDELIEPESAELPLGRSADPQVDEALSRKMLPQDDTSGAALYGEREPSGEEPIPDSLEEIFDVGSADEGERGEAYDAVNPESLGAVWLERATQTTHDARLDASNPNDLPELDELTLSEASLSTSRLGADDAEAETDEDLDDEELDDEELGDEDDDIADDELDEDGETSGERREPGAEKPR